MTSTSSLKPYIIKHDITVTLTLIFEDSNRPTLKWLKRGFQHVHAVKDYGGFKVHINPCQSHTKIGLIDCDISKLAGVNATILKTTVHPYSDSINRGLGLNSCVDVMKGLLGIKSIFIQTPHQLYEYLHG